MFILDAAEPPAGAGDRTQVGEWDVPDALGLYVSIPFCRAKCTFCNFASGAFPPERMEAYVARVVREIAAAPQIAEAVGGVLPRTVDTVYLGGGTPSLLSPSQLRSLLEAVQAHFDVMPGAEITMEAAPGQIDDALLDEALRLRINRVSLGVQSFVDREARAVGRSHTGDACRQEVARLLERGVTRVSLDLIAGLPHQTAESFEYSLHEATASGVEHVSVYMLETDGESRLGTEVERLRAESQLTVLGQQARYHANAAPSEEACAALYQQACAVLSAHGFAQYEISNFARQGAESQGAESLHNRRYWDRRPYLGVGLDAHSMLPCADGSAVRFRNADEFDSYMNVQEPEEVTPVDALSALEECVFLGLRRTEGLSLAELERWQQPSLLQGVRERAKVLVEGGLLRCEDGRLQLTAQGRVLSSSVFGELLTVSG